MTKELDALKRIRQETCSATYNQDFDKNECCDIIEQALQRLEAIDNANPSEALEILYNNAKLDRDRIEQGGVVTYAEEIEHNEEIKPYYDTLKQALLKAQEKYDALDEIKSYLEEINETLEYAVGCIDD